LPFTAAGEEKTGSVVPIFAVRPQLRQPLRVPAGAGHAVDFGLELRRGDRPAPERLERAALAQCLLDPRAQGGFGEGRGGGRVAAPPSAAPR
jgi:hypothetical protein